MKLTAKQHITFKFIQKYIFNHGIAPTEAEIAEGIGITSRGVVHRYVKALEAEGLVEIIPHRRRNIRLICDDDVENNLSLPVIGKIAAGSPIEALPCDQVLDLSDKLLGGNRFILEVKGDSMIGDNICDGDYIICESCNDLPSGEIVIVLVDRDEATLKRCRRNSDQTITLIPSNPKMSPQIYESGRIQIQGKYLGLLRLN